MPKISIIVPVYQSHNYLEQGITSILSQTMNDWELLLVDDGSIDKSGELCDSFAENDDRIRVFHKKNGGASSARNLGINNAFGEWITFVDSDDFIDRHFLEGLYQPLADGNELDFIHGGCMNYHNGQITSINQRYENYYGNDKDKLFSSFRGLIVSKLFKREILVKNEILFDERMKIAEDMHFTMQYLLYVEYYAFVTETGYYYRRDNIESATHRFNWLDYEQSRYAFIRLYAITIDNISHHNISDIAARIRYEQRANQYYRMLRSLYHDNSIKRSKRLQILREESESKNALLLIHINTPHIGFLPIFFFKKKYIFIFDILQYIIEKIAC